MKQNPQHDLVFAGMVTISLAFIFSFTFLIPERYIEPKLETYYNTYVKQLDNICPGKFKEPHQLIVNIKPLDGAIVGLCITLFTKRYMYIDQNHWDFSDDYKRKQTLYHEFTHCLLDKNHVDNPNHYMYYRDNTILPHVFESQVVADMREWCKTE